MNKNDHDTEIGNEEECVDECVLEVRRIREELYREFNYDSDALVEYANKEAGKITGNVVELEPPPLAFPPSQRFLDFVAMLDRQEKEKQRRCATAAAQPTKTPVRAVAAAHAGI